MTRGTALSRRAAGHFPGMAPPRVALSLCRVVGPCVAAALCAVAGYASAQEIIAAEPTPAPRWPFPFPRPVQATPASVPAAAAALPTAEPRPPADPDAGKDAMQAAAGRSADRLAWSKLTPAQQAALEPLAREWASIDGNRKQKWLEIAERLPRMSAAERARMQTRMAEWTRMTPQQRAQVRLYFQEAKQVAPQHRKESWDAYLALPAEQRRQLAERATKSNIVVAPEAAAVPRPVAPTVVQAQPGATTTLMSRRPTPPPHQQTGLPKIAATPEFVDRATLLPQRGAQGAAVRAVAASEPVVPRR
jgi:hypothetical protein